MPLPYFAPNGAIVTEQLEDQRYRVSPKEGVPAGVVHLDVTFNGKPWVGFPTTWLRTDDELAEACELARAAVAMYRKSVREGVGANA